jgi:hypothetical protein
MTASGLSKFDLGIHRVPRRSAVATVTTTERRGTLRPTPMLKLDKALVVCQALILG